MGDVNLVGSVRQYVDALVHASVRDAPLAAERHRVFIAPRLIGGLIALAALPLYLAARGTPNAVELVIFGSLIAPIAAAYFLSSTGQYEDAHIFSAVSLTGVVSVVALMSGGVTSPAVVWLALVPLEASLSSSRRVVLIAAGLAFAALGLVVLGTGMTSAPPGVQPWGLALGGAVAYAGLLALGHELTARGSARRLDAEEQRYRLLALNMTDVISRHGRHGAVLFISPAAEAMFRTTADDLAGHGLFDRVHVADRPAYLKALADAASAEGERAVEFRVRRNGPVNDMREAPHFIWVEMRCHAVSEAAGEGGGEVVAVMRDVSKRKEQEQALEEARSAAVQANAAKSRFLATMSHELRTPLNAVIGFSEMLTQEGPLNLDAVRRQDYARLIHESGQHLLSVVNLVLDMSKIESGNFVITPEPFAPAAVIRSCCDLLALRARDAKLDIAIRLPDSLPEINADKRALKQMLLNLLSNAIKFTASGGRVTVSAVVAGPNIEISVEDTGVGIAAEDISRIGDPFFQARASYDRPYEGTGLGLSIVKGLATLHGGKFIIDSKPGVGTRATVRLPLDCEKAQPAPASPVVSINPDARRDGSAAPAPVTIQSAPSFPDRQVKKSA